MSAILVGNSFPLSLIRRRVTIEPVSLAAFERRATGAVVYSYWGHTNTLRAARDFLSVDVSPTVGRPAVCLSEDGFPTLGGVVFTDCWVLSPSYREGFRPAVGEEVGSKDIADWQILHMEWEG